MEKAGTDSGRGWRPRCDRQVVSPAHRAADPDPLTAPRRLQEHPLHPHHDRQLLRRLHPLRGRCVGRHRARSAARGRSRRAAARDDDRGRRHQRAVDEGAGELRRLAPAADTRPKRWRSRSEARRAPRSELNRSSPDPWKLGNHEIARSRVEHAAPRAGGDHGALPDPSAAAGGVAKPGRQHECRVGHRMAAAPLDRRSIADGDATELL